MSTLTHNSVEDVFYFIERTSGRGRSIQKNQLLLWNLCHSMRF